MTIGIPDMCVVDIISKNDGIHNYLLLSLLLFFFQILTELWLEKFSQIFLKNADVINNFLQLLQQNKTPT